MWYENLLNYWHFKKGILSLDALSNVWWPSRYLLHNLENHWARDLIFSSSNQMNKRFDFNGLWAHLMPTSMPTTRLKLIQIFRNKSFSILIYTQKMY